MASKELDKIIEEYNTYEMRNQFINDERLKAFCTIKKALLRWLLKLKTVPLAMILRDTLVHLKKEKKPERKMHSLISPRIFPVKTKRQPE